MNKKTYVAPVVKRVELEVKSAILAVCHTSAVTMDPQLGPTPCSISLSCYNPN